MGQIKNIVLTGASGYLGSNLLKQLIADGYNVSILIRRTSDLTRIKEFISVVNVYYTEDKPYSNLFEDAGVDLVIHTAASYGRKSESVLEVQEANVTFPLALIQEAVKQGVPYFINTDTTLPRMLNSYTLSKKQFTDWLEYFQKQITILNIEVQYFYGPGDDHSKLITGIAGKLVSDIKSIDFTAAEQKRDFIYIDDAVNAYMVLIRNLNKLNSFTAVELGSGKAIMLKEILLQLKQLSGNQSVHMNFGALPMRPGDIMFAQADIHYLQQLGWKPAYSLEQGLSKTLQYEKEQINK